MTLYFLIYPSPSLPHVPVMLACGFFTGLCSRHSLPGGTIAFYTVLLLRLHYGFNIAPFANYLEQDKPSQHT